MVGLLFKFSHVGWCKNFRSESGVIFFIFEMYSCVFSIRHIQPCSTCAIHKARSI